MIGNRERFSWGRGYANVQINGQQIRQVEMLVDAGADLCMFPRQLGLDIGLSTTQGDVVYDAMGVGEILIMFYVK
jgi:predicted aspartyl protease